MKTLKMLKTDYEDYLRHQRGLSERTIYHCWRFADRFITFRFKGKPFDPSKLKAVDIAKFMEHITSRRTPFRDKTPPTHLRNFFRYLFYAGHTTVNLAPSVPRVAHRLGSTLSRYLAPKQGAGAAHGSEARHTNWAAGLCHGSVASPARLKGRGSG